jgi:hypothetical protein
MDHSIAIYPLNAGRMQNALILVFYWFSIHVPFFTSRNFLQNVSSVKNSVSERCARPLAELDASEFMINGILMKCDTVGL